MKRIFSATLACALALTLLTSCSSKDTPSAPAGSVGSSQSGTSSSTPDTSVPENGSTSIPPVPLPEVLASLALNKVDFTLNAAGAAYKLKADITGTDTLPVWTSSDETVATVAEDGTVTAVAPGTATITATVDEMTAECIVRCVWQEQTEIPGTQPETPSVSAIDLGTFYWDLYSMLYPADKDGNSTGPFVDNIAAIPDMLDGYYPGLSAANTNQCYVFMPMMSGVPYEVALIEAASSNDAETIKTILQARIDTEKNNHMAYPMVVENWELNSRIVTNGNYILMAVTSDFDAYVKAFNALF